MNKQTKIQIIRSKDPAPYVDAVMVKWKAFSFQFSFCQEAESNPSLATLNEVSTIITNPQQAKILQLVLAKELEAYEKQFGQIAIPNEINI